MEYEIAKPEKNVNALQFKGGQAYNKDGILINNIQAYTKNYEVNFEEILKYFQSLSKNIKVSLLTKPKYLIEFADAKDAGKVLQKSEHFIAKHLLYVEPCSSWFQPHIKNFIKYIDQKNNDQGFYEFEENNSLTQSNEQNICFITKLNDDCLMEICQKLCLKDQINFAFCCQRFCDIFQMISCKKYAYFNMEDLQDLSCLQTKIFGLCIGSYVKSLQYYDSRYSEYFCLYCPNIETLKIDCVVLGSELLTYFQIHMPKIKKLELRFITWSNNLTEQLKDFKNLKYLYISSHDVTGEYLATFVKLKELSLYECYYLERNYFQDICENLKNLKYLDIRYCVLLKTNSYVSIAENLIQLETLKFTNTQENFTSICRLPQLKILEINHYYDKNINDLFFNELVKYQAQQLLELKFDDVTVTLEQISLIAKLKNLKVFYCTGNNDLNDNGLEQLSQLTKLQEIDFYYCFHISNEGIVKLLENCLELKKLNLVDCERLSSDLIRNILKLLQQQYEQNLRSHRVHIIIEDIELFQNVVDELGLRFPNHLLKITLKEVKNEFINFNVAPRRRPNKGPYICHYYGDPSLNSSMRYYD